MEFDYPENPEDNFMDPHADSSSELSNLLDSPTLNSMIVQSPLPPSPLPPLDSSSSDAAPTFVCPHGNCGRTFLSKRGLTAHERNKHADVVMVDKPFKCATCGLGFTRVSSLNKHVALKHTPDPKPSTTDPEPVEPVEPVPEAMEVESCGAYGEADEYPMLQIPPPLPVTHGPYSLHDQLMMYQAQNQLLTEQMNRVFDFFMQQRRTQ